MSGGTVKVSGSSYGCLENYGTFNITGGTLNGQNSSGGCISNNSGAKLTISGTSTYIYGKSSGGSVCLSNKGTATINGGYLYGYTSNTILNTGGTLYINGGTINSTASNYPTVYNKESGYIYMTAGTITNSGSGYTLYNYSGTIKKTGGTSNNNYGVTT